jgi:hypothetical protein
LDSSIAIGGCIFSCDENDLEESVAFCNMSLSDFIFLMEGLCFLIFSVCIVCISVDVSGFFVLSIGAVPTIPRTKLTSVKAPMRNPIAETIGSVASV